MEFLKEPKSNPDTVLQCYLTALEKLDYRVENLHQPPAQAALNADPNFMMIVDDGYWIRHGVFYTFTVSQNSGLKLQTELQFAWA